MKKILKYFKLMRIKHYFKNLLLFLPLIFSGNLFNYSYLGKTIFGFFIFSLGCSIVYIVNDIFDRKRDRLHETKKDRPIASGDILVKEAIILIILLVFLGILCILYISIKLYSLILLVIYLVINIGYSLGLKNIPLLDIVILTLGFLIRILLGASINDIEVSNWLYLTVMSMAFYFALGKRRGEINNNNNNTRIVLKYYGKDFLDKCMYMCLSNGIVFYSLWSVDLDVINRINSNLVWTVLLVVIICMRYSMIVENNCDGDPIEIVFHDKVLLLLVFFYGIVIIGLLYI